MTNRRAKIATAATVAGLAALGGVALGSNPGVPAPSGQLASSGGSAAVVTGASGAAVSTTQTAAVKSEVRPPIVTRASGAPGAAPVDD